MSRRLLYVAALCGAAMPASSWAQAQAQDARSDQTQASVAGKDASSPEQDSQGLADIVVTAQRRTESLQRAAIAATAVTGDTLINAGVTESAQLTKLVPALTVQPAGVSTSFFLRGVGATAINSFQENAVSFSVGGIFYARPQAPDGTFFDLDRVEVLKGPQGTLYGRNATGGAINLIPRRPELDKFAADLTAEYGSYNSKKIQGGVSVPLGSSLALRLAGQVVDHDGYNSDGYDDEKIQAVRGTLLFEPSPRFSMLLSADYTHQGGKGPGSVLLASPATPTVPPPGARIGAADPQITAILQQLTFNQFGQVPPFSFLLSPAAIRTIVTNPALDGFQDSHFWGASLTTNGDLGFADLTTILAYRKSSPNLFSYLPGFPSRFQESDDQMTGEIRLSSKPGTRLQYVLGAFYFYEQQDSFNNYNQGALANTVYLPRLKTQSEAVFGQATYEIFDGFRLVGGGRYTNEDKSLVGSTRNTSFFVPNAPFVPISGSLNFNRFTYKAGFEYDLGARSLVYGNVSTGFKAGGFYPSAGKNTYNPETLTAFTLGSKNRFFDNRLQLNVEAFYWKYRDQQISYVGPIEATPGNFAQAGVTVNAGRSRIYGAEVELLVQATPHDTFGADVQYLNGKYQSLIYNAISTSGAPLLTTCAVSNDTRVATAPTRLFIVNCSGKPGINSPKLTVNLSYEHRFDIGDFGLVAGARSRIESGSYVNIDYLDFQRRAAYTTSDAYLTLNSPGSRYSITGFVNNFENSAVIAGGLTRPISNTTIFALRAPRTYGVRLGVKY